MNASGAVRRLVSRSEQPEIERYSSSEREVFRIMTGALSAKVLAVSTDLGVFEYLAKGAKEADELTHHLGMLERPGRILLDALVSMGLLVARGDRYANGPLADTLLVPGRADFQGPHIRLFDHLHAASAQLLGALFEERPPCRDYDYFFRSEAPATGGYSDLMHDSSTIPAMVLPQYWDFSDSERVLDLGGGYGRLCMTLVTQYPHLEAVLFDLPDVCARAALQLARHPELSDRITIQAGDFFNDPLPKADTVVLMRIAHDWPVERLARLLAQAYAALPSGGRLLIYETIKGQTEDPGDAALISLLLLLISPAGRCRTFEEMRELLTGAGFVRVDLIPTVYFYGLIVAEKA